MKMTHDISPDLVAVMAAEIKAGEKAVSAAPYVAGDSFTAADVYIGSHISWGIQFGTMETRPAFEAYVAPLRTRTAYQRAKAIDNALIAEMQAANPA